MSEYFLEMRDITKDFPGVRALDGIAFNLKKGEIHALVGENGAGKSTLIKILGGIYPYGTYDGEILINNVQQRFHSIRDAERAGIAVIHQELALVPEMTIGENIFLGREPGIAGVVDWNKLYLNSTDLIRKLNLDVSPQRQISQLGVGQKQLVEVAKALSRNASILVLDEPTSALTEEETEMLLSVLRDLKNRGVACIYISHRIEEVFEIADRITVLRDGKIAGEGSVSEIDHRGVVSMMVGRDLKEMYPRQRETPGEIALEIRNFSVQDSSRPSGYAVQNISFSVRQGEVLGIAGLMGAGRTELLNGIFGAFAKKTMGEILLDGKPVDIKSPSDAIRNGIALVTEDRKRYGLVSGDTVLHNITLASLGSLTICGIINNNEEIRRASGNVKDLSIKTASLETVVNNLSGGNQQKVVVAKWLMTAPRVLLLDEPTRGIDVGAKVEMYKIINELALRKTAIVMVSSELPELLGMSDRIIVLHDGKIAGEFVIEEATQEKIMLLATGGR